MGGAAHRFFLDKAREKVRQAISNSIIPKFPRATTFSTTYTAKYSGNLHHVPWVYEDPSHLLHKKCMALVKEQPRKGLWWSVTTSIATSQRRTVRSWTTRRFKAALQEALKANGYNTEGIAVAGSNGELKKDLHGSLRVIAQESAIAAPKALIDAELSALVRCLSPDTPQETKHTKSFNVVQRIGKDVAKTRSRKNYPNLNVGNSDNIGRVRLVSMR